MRVENKTDILGAEGETLDGYARERFRLSENAQAGLADGEGSVSF